MAADTEIKVVITGVASDLRRALEGAKGDLGGLKAAIRDVPNQIKIGINLDTAPTSGKLGLLASQMKRLKEQIESPMTPKAEVEPAIFQLGRLTAAYKRLRDQAADAAIAERLAASGGGADANALASMFRGDRSSPSALATALRTGASGGGGLLAAGPGVFGMGTVATIGAAGAAGGLGLLGSAGQGILGAGAIGAAGAGAVGIGGLLPLLTLVKPALGDVRTLAAALTNLQQVQELYGKNAPALAAAQNKYNAAVAAFGPNSAGAKAAYAQLQLAQNQAANTAPQVVRAQMAVNKLMLESSPQAAQLALAFSGLDSAMNDAGLKIIPALSRVLVPLINAFKDLLPTLVTMAKIDLTGIEIGLRPLIAIMRSTEFKSLLVQLAHNFAQLMPLVFRGLGDILMAFMRTAVAAGPAMLQMAGAFTGLLDKFAAFTKSPQFGPFIQKIIGQFQTWLGLAAAVAKLVWGILTAGSASGGQTLVQVLTQIVTAVTPALTIAFQGIATLIGAIASAIIALTGPLPGILKIVPALLVGAAVLTSWRLLKDLITGASNAAKPIVPVTPGAAGAGAAGAAASARRVDEIMAATAAQGTPMGRPAAEMVARREARQAAEAASAGISSGRLLVGGGIALLGTEISQMLGQSIHGALGKAVSDIGTGASIGGGLGSVFGPWGAAAGAALGAGAGAAIDLITSRGPSDGEKWAKGFSASLPGQLSDAVKQGLAKAADQPIQTPIPVPGAPGSGPRMPSGRFSPQITPAQILAINAGNFAQGIKISSDAGKVAGQAFVSSMASKVTVATPLLITRDIAQALKDVPKPIRAAGAAAVTAWQDNAAKEMIAYATSLEQHGKLPKGSVDQLIATLEHQFPGLIAYLDQAGLNSAAAIASHLKLTDALSNLKGALGNMRSQWGDTAIALKITDGNIYSNTAQAMSDLRLLMQSKNRQIRTEAKTEYDLLKHDVATSFGAMVSQTDTSMSKMSALIQGGSKTAAAAGAQNMDALAMSIWAAMQSGVLSTTDGTKLIGAALNNALKAFGGKPIPLGSISGTGAAVTLSSLGAIASKGISGAIGHAVGGYIGRPGEKGRDEVDITVGRGEAILNDTQQQVANRYLAPIGGVAGLFHRTKGSLHYMARGGFAGGGPSGAAFSPNAMLNPGPSAGSGNTPQIALPLPRGSWYSSPSVDMGVDYPAPAGTPEYAMGPGKIITEGIQGFGPWAPVLAVNAGPLAGRNVYYGHAGPNFAHVGQSVSAGQQISQVGAGILGISTGPHLEVGFGPPFGRGDAMLSIIQSLLGGGTPSAAQIGAAGGAGAVAQVWQAIKAPKWTGPGGALGQIGQAALAKVTAAANKYGASKVASANAAAGAGAFTGTLSGPVEQQVYQFMSAAGFNKVAIAGMLGNAVQESGMNPSTPGGGLWQQISNFGQGAPPLLVQMQTMLPQIQGLKAAMNAAGSPGAAATIFMQQFERPAVATENLPRRVAGANAAFAAGFAPGGFAPGGRVPRPKAPRPATRPHPPPKTTHHHAKGKYAPLIPKDALKGLLSGDQLKPDNLAAMYARQVTVADQVAANLPGYSGIASAAPYPELATLSDADVAVLDPGGKLGYQAGDQIVNRTGMTVGRWFGPGGQIMGGTYQPGASTRLAEIAKILTNRGSRYGSLLGEQGASEAAVDVDEGAIKQREHRKARIERFLHANVRRAGVISAELGVLKDKNLAQALKAALSKQAIAGRLSGLRAHLRTVGDELLAERSSQAQLTPMARDPTHEQALEFQAQALRDSIAVETQLGRSGTATVNRAKSAIYKKDLTDQLAALSKANVTLGGHALVAGTGGAIGSLLGQIKTLGADRDTRTNALADFKQVDLIPSQAEIAGYLKEQTNIGQLANIQVRTPGATAAGTGPDLSAMLALQTTLTQQAQQAFGLSQAQFADFQGFVPLLQGRLLGSFATGIDRVPQTGPYLLHRDEMVIPDPAGPQYNRAATSGQGAQQPIQIDLHFDKDAAPFIKLVRGEMNQHALQIVSDHSGQRARLLAGVRRS